jgi:hypothetical protein
MAMHLLYSLLLLVVLLVASANVATGFVLPSTGGSNGRRSLTRQFSSNKDAEIAQLEAKLRQLKEQASREEESASASASASADDEFTGRVSEPFVEMLTEQWKEGDPAQANQSGSPIVAVVGAIGLAVVLGLLSQIPVGQEELNKYSSIKSGTVTQSIDLGDLNAARKSLY